MSTTRTAVLAATIASLLPAAGYAQQQQREKPTLRSDEQKKQDAEIERDYNRVMKGIRAQTPPSKYDPWQTVRPVDNEGGKK
jgi:hypothetical protein